MVDYLTATGAHQRFNILQSMRNQLGRRHFAPYYRDARNAIRRFHAGNGNALEAAVDGVLTESGRFNCLYADPASRGKLAVGPVAKQRKTDV